MTAQPNEESVIENGESASEEAVIAWVRANALPLQQIEAGNGFVDLQPLKQLLQEVKVVGLGETTHGTREIFQLKHRLVEFLVTEMGFTHFAIEASYAACQPLNDYILHGIGDRATALTAQWYVVWDTEELSALVDWLRAYNQGLPDVKKVKFYGTDQTLNGNGRAFVLDYLSKVAPEAVANTAPLFDALAFEEDKGLLGIDAEFEAMLVQLSPRLQELIEYFSANEEAFVSRSSRVEYNQAFFFLRVMQQWVTANAAALRPPTLALHHRRATQMGENLLYFIEQAGPDDKFIVWEHNGHLTEISPQPEAPNIGATLRQKYGQRFFSIAFEFNQGSFHTRRLLLQEKALGDLVEVTLPPSDAHSLGWIFSHVDAAHFFINLRTAVADPLVYAWLAQPQPMHSIGWLFDEADVYNLEMHSALGYDAFIFIESTTASRPTPNALRRIANHEGL